MIRSRGGWRSYQQQLQDAEEAITRRQAIDRNSLMWELRRQRDERRKVAVVLCALVVFMALSGFVGYLVGRGGML